MDGNLTSDLQQTPALRLSKLRARQRALRAAYAVSVTIVSTLAVPGCATSVAPIADPIVVASPDASPVEPETGTITDTQTDSSTVTSPEDVVAQPSNTCLDDESFVQCCDRLNWPCFIGDDASAGSVSCCAWGPFVPPSMQG